MVGNLIAKNSVLAKWCEIKTVHVTRVNIYDRAGKISWAAKWTPDEVRQLEAVAGYQGVSEGVHEQPHHRGRRVQNEWIRWGKRPAWSKFSEIVLYIDPSFKGSTKTTLRPRSSGARSAPSSGTSAHLSGSAPWLKWSAGVMTSTSGRAPQGIAVRWYMEANFMQDTILDEFRREGNCAATSSPLPATSAKSPTSSSASKPSALCGSAVLLPTTKHSATTPTCSPALTGLLLLKRYARPRRRPRCRRGRYPDFTA